MKQPKSGLEKQKGERGGAAPSSRSFDPSERARGFAFPKAILERIEAGHDAILSEIKPSKAQIERGLALHYGSYVADAQGGSTMQNRAIVSDRLQKDLESIRVDFESKGLPAEEVAERVGDAHTARKTFESAFDEQWIAMSRGLYGIAGMDLAEEDVTHPGENTFDIALDRLSRSVFAYDRRSDLIRVTSVGDIERGSRKDKPCVILKFSAPGCFAEAEDPVKNLDLFYALGLRMAQLTYYRKNRLCCSYQQLDDTGLTDLGKEVVRRMNELGIMIDLAHCGHRSAMDTVAASTDPVLLSHIGCKSLFDDAENDGYLNNRLLPSKHWQEIYKREAARGVEIPRKIGNVNASDELIGAVARSGGIVAILMIPQVLAKGPESFDAWFKHVEHAIAVGGVDHVASGTDRTFFPDWKPAPLDWTNWPYFTVGLVCRGLTDEEVRKIIGENYRGYVNRVLDKKPWGVFH